MSLSLSLVVLAVVVLLILLVVKISKFIMKFIVLAVLIAIVFTVFNFDILNLNSKVDNVKDYATEKGEILLEADCMAKKGVWMESINKCNYTYEDANKTCMDSGECKGLCIAGSVNDSTGNCQESSLADYYFVMENNKAKEVNQSEGLYQS
ncbi:MAG: hypothetical protein PHT54_02825 [Candidatus Nanoarchaeia archaeon]|nr:hypothetical protein [Candidatus Nanoarchaeia archaeon]